MSSSIDYSDSRASLRTKVIDYSDFRASLRTKVIDYSDFRASLSAKSNMDHTAECFGIANQNNRCYLISILQALFSLPTFIAKIRQYTDETTMAGMLNAMLNSHNIDYVYDTLIAGSRNNLLSGQQADAAEAFEYLLGLLGDDFISEFRIGRDTKAECPYCRFDSVEETAIHIRSDVSPDYINSYIQDEQVFGCDGCYYRKNTRVTSTSNIIMLSLDYKTIANEGSGSFPDILNVNIRGTYVQYQALARVDKHGAGIVNGHYTASCIRRPNGVAKVVKFNDDNVTYSNETTLPQDPNTYVVFYNRI